MANINIVIPDAQLSRFLTAICAMRGYTGFQADGTTPQTQAQFAKSILIDHAKKYVIAYESQIASLAAENTVITDINNISVT